MLFRRLTYLLPFLLLLSRPLTGPSQVKFTICIPSSWTGGGSGQLTIDNLTGGEVPSGSTLEIDWEGITSISPWAGFTISGIGPYTLTLTSSIPAGGSSGPLGFGFTNSGPYFTPPEALLNGETISATSPPCYVPASYANFDCETSLATPCFHPTQTEGEPGEIRIGQGTVYSWGAALDVYIPENRKTWAIAMAVGHTMFTNLVGADVLSINEYFATGIQETNCGCDADITEPGWVTSPYPDHETDNPIYCFDYTHGVAVGFFQEEYGTGWLELDQDIPCFIPTFNFDTVIVGKNFESQVIGKVYHDYNNLMFLQYIKCFDIMDFLVNCTDPYGPEKLIAAIYNRGMNSGFIEDMLVDNRAAAIATDDLLNYIPGLGQQYAEQISRVTAVLDNNFSEVSIMGTGLYGIPWEGVHNHLNFYDEPISWADINTYLDQIETMYSGVGVDILTIKSQTETVFNSINDGAPVSFRYEMGSVIDAIVQQLPAFEPMPGLGSIYGSSGGDDCNFPTAKLEGSTTICQGETAQLSLFLTGDSPWTVSYEHNGTSTTLSDIVDSPYMLEVLDSGLYYLTSVSDATGTPGKVICDSILITYSDSLEASFTALPGSLCIPDSLQITFSGTGPWSINYSTPTDEITEDTITSSPYTLPYPIVTGTYILETVENDQCAIILNDTLTITSSDPPSTTLPAAPSACTGTTILMPIYLEGTAPYTLHFSFDGIDSLVLAPTDTLILSFTETTELELLTLTDAFCADTINATTLITFHDLPEFTLLPDTSICAGNVIFLETSSDEIDLTYTWSGGVSGDTPLTPDTTTTYYVAATNTARCLAYDSTTIIVYPLPEIEAGMDQLICSGTTITLNGTGAGPGGSYTWTNDVINATPFTIDTSNHFQVIGTDVNGCSGQDSLTITVYPNPEIAINADNKTGCTPLPVQFSISATGEIEWQTGDGSVLYGTMPFYTYTDTGLYDVSVMITTPEGCISHETYSAYIHVLPQPIANFSYSTGNETLSGTTISFENHSEFAYEYLWNFGDGTHFSTETNPSHSFTSSSLNTYPVTLIASTSLDCADTSTQFIPASVPLLYYIPNTFTPDGNTLNNIFKPVFTSGYDPYDYHLTIFNQWGERVFESYNTEYGWDGTYGGGALVEDGIYIWHINFSLEESDNRMEQIGHVMLLK